MRTAFYLVLISILICSCKRESDTARHLQKFDEGPVISVINSDTISAEYFEKAYIEYLLNSGTNDTRENRYKLLQQISDEILLSQQAEKYNLLDSDYESYHDQVKKITIADRFFTSAFLDTLSAPTEEQIQTAFFNSKIKMYVSHLFFTDKKLADAAYQRLENGQHFLDLANEVYHLTEYDSAAGFLGEISYFNVDDAFGEAAYQLKAGEYSKPVRSRQGYHIIYVNERIGNPLMTTQEYNYKKRGITGLTKNRIKKLKGDAFVRTYMKTLNIKVDESVAEQIYLALKELKPATSSDSPQIRRQSAFYNSADVELLKQELSPETILASYEHLGESKYFTAEDYFNWLKTLPMEEAQNRTMASIGRALRNQIFYEAGMEKNLKNDESVKFHIDYKSNQYKSYRVKRYLSELPLPEISEKEREEAFYALGLNSVKQQQVSGWFIEAENFEEAEKFKTAIVREEQLPESYNTYMKFENRAINQLPDVGSHLMKAPLNNVMIAATDKNFYVFEVSDKQIEYSTTEDAEKELSARIANSYNIVNEIKALRENAVIKTDTAAFESLMDHFNDPALKGF